MEGSTSWVMADPVRLRQMLFNLIGNAVKFTNSGTVEVRLATGRHAGDETRIRFEIEDTGIGIPMQAQEHLFSRFRQADASTERRFGGTGLGLNITRSIARMMGGDVGFKSQEGEGSVFWIEFTAPTTTPNISSQDDRVATPLEGLNLLVVDDNPTNRLVASRILESLGAVVDVAEDGLYGLEALGLQSYDAILMDVEMPRMGGLEATRRIRAFPEPVGATPIIGLTANVEPQKWVEYRAAGMDGVVGKPFSIKELVSEISRARTARASTGTTTERSITPN
jgi:CheY-like chemotaxis protein